MKHETRNTTEVLAWCNTCNRKTRHSVSDRRVGTCVEHGGSVKCEVRDAELRSKKQIENQKRREEEERNLKLF